MTASLATVEAEALTLSPEDRVALADHLLASLVADSEVEDAWVAEVSRRVASIESGQASASPVEQVIARARQAIG